jgi:hypothetical protein
LTLPAVATTDLEVRVGTTGGDPDTNGYVVVLDDLPRGAVGSNASVTIREIGTGPHRLALSGVAPNCDVNRPMPFDIIVLLGDPLVQLHVYCLATGISVRVNVSGPDADPAGFPASLNGGPAVPAFPQVPLLFGRLSPGWHVVSLSSPAPNCTVQGESTRQVLVLDRTVTNADFDIACTAVTGSLEVTVASTGDDIDWDGYLVHVEDGPSIRIGADTTVVIPGVFPGLRTIHLEDIIDNCAIAGSDTRTAAVSTGEVTSLAFGVTCATAEKIAFSRWFDSGASVMLAFAAGGGESPLVAGASPAWSRDGQELVVSRYDCSFFYYYYGCVGIGLLVTDRDGHNPRPITHGEDDDADWSPDGGRVAFSRLMAEGYRLFVVNADGTGESMLTVDGFAGDARHPSWSPDGSRLAFECGVNTVRAICVVNADGSGFAQLTTLASLAYAPSWSPDGLHIAFTQAGMVAVMNADGSDVHVLAAGDLPAWSPDGTRVAFTAHGSAAGIYVINADGTSLVRVTTGDNDARPAWRP